MLCKMGEEIINIQSPVDFDESISHYEIHAHKPYASSSFDNSDEIRIAIQHQDLCLLPSKSYLYISGKLTKVDGTAAAHTTLPNNAISFLFDEIRYELNAVEIDRNKNVGITSIMKGYASINPSMKPIVENAGWRGFDDNYQLNYTPNQIIDKHGNFDCCIPLSMLLGFAEDYQKIIVNAKHELIISRSKTDDNAILQTQDDEEFKFSIQKVEWHMPYVTVSDERKIQLLKFIGRDTPILMSYRAWELYEYPVLPETSRHVWAVKTSTQLEKPRYVILGFQTGRKNRKKKNMSAFDHCNIVDFKLHLNSQCYPYGNMNLDISKSQYARLYEMYTSFQTTYYNKGAEPWLRRKDFLNHAPLVIIDCSRQNDALKLGPVDVRLEFETSDNIPANTSAYCLIIHDRIVEYNPISGTIKKIV